MTIIVLGRDDLELLVSLSSARESYLLSKGFVRDWIMATLIVAITIVGASTFYPILRETGLGGFIEDQISQLRELVGGGSSLPLVLLIILNNIRVLLIITITIPTIILPISILALQGAIVGYLTSWMLENPVIEASPEISITITPMYIFLALIIHGIIEIPAFSLVLAPLMSFRKRGIKSTFKLSLSLLPLSMLMLVIAAVIESVITPTVVSLYIIISS